MTTVMGLFGPETWDGVLPNTAAALPLRPESLRSDTAVMTDEATSR